MNCIKERKFCMLTRRRVLKDLQVSSDDKLRVPASSTMVNHKKSLAKTAEDLKISKQDKQTRQKNANAENNPIKPSKKVKPKNPNSKNKNNAPHSELHNAVVLNQSRIESFLSPDSTLKYEFTELDRGNVTVNTSFTEDIAKITSDIPPQSYWQDLAEQRQIAIENTLHENEMINDHLNVLQSENLQLKGALEAANQVLKMAGIMD